MSKSKEMAFMRNKRPFNHFIAYLFHSVDDRKPKLEGTLILERYFQFRQRLLLPIILVLLLYLVDEPQRHLKVVLPLTVKLLVGRSEHEFVVREDQLTRDVGIRLHLHFYQFFLVQDQHLARKHIVLAQLQLSEG